jgi:uncharacterized membrane protein
MHRAGKITLYVGIALIVIGMIVGFSAMFMDKDNLAKVFLGLVPIGFVLLLTGTVATQLSVSSKDNKSKPE